MLFEPIGLRYCKQTSPPNLHSNITGFVQQRFHCSCYARNESLVVRQGFFFVMFYFVQFRFFRFFFLFNIIIVLKPEPEFG